MRNHLEAGLVVMIALACAVFAALLFRGPARGEERTVGDAWRAWRSWWQRGPGVVPKGGGPEALVTLSRDQVFRLPDGGEMTSVRVEEGMVVVTREGDSEDHVLQAGAELRVPSRGLALAWALEPSRVEVRRIRAERAGERPTVGSAIPEAR